MKNRNAYYLEFDIEREGKVEYSGNWIEFSSSLNAAKQNVKGQYHRIKGVTKFKFTKVECLGENVNWDEFMEIKNNYLIK